MSEAAVAETPAAVETPAATTTFLGTPAASAPAAAATPSHLFGDHVQQDGAFKEGWTNSLAEKFPRVANTAMRYKTEGDFLQGLDHALGLVGKKTAGVSYPNEVSTPEELAAFRTAAGVPGRVEEYNLKPEKLPDGVAWDDATGKQFAAIMHANHIPAGAAKALVEAHLQTLATQGQGEATAKAAKLSEMVQKTTAEFQKEWGIGYQDRFNALQDFVGARLSPEDMADPALQVALSHPAMVRIVDEARRASREAPLPGAANTGGMGSMSPRQQGLEIMKANPRWRQDPEMSKRVNDLYAQEAAGIKRRG